MSLGSTIKKLRKEKGLNQKELSLLCNVSLNAICSIETDSRMPHKKTLAKLAKSLNTTESILIFMSIDENDIPEDKRPVFRILYNTMEKVIFNTQTTE